ncbi:MAG: phospho-sugar mutase [Oscillospiraceae bacterium]|nr:phospho-sugar mutase [Oscillospiraceae bacterium]
MTVNEIYRVWCEKASGDLGEELRSIAGNDAEINERFYRMLEFGTGGLRGVIGAGTNRMNVHTVALAAQGMADWLLAKGGTPSVAIGRDSRNKSDVFAETAACVLAANGVQVYYFREIQPTPMLSFAVRELKCSAGIVIPASHNPAQYNGFKCNGADGCQFTDKNAREVEAVMAGLDVFDDVKLGFSFDEFVEQGKIKYISDELIEKYLGCVQACQVEREAARSADLRVVYTPLCGAGNKPVREILRRIGVHVTVVSEQEEPNGDFPRCPKPNPEIREAFLAAEEVAAELMQKGEPADLLIATDPDCDRVGIEVLRNGNYVPMTGNEVGALMLDYLLSRRRANGTLPLNPVAVKTIVTTALADEICREYGCELRSCLTGFKYIGEIITNLELEGQENRFVMGFEESYGYLAGTYARDKDAVVGAMLISEMAAYYKLQGKTLLDVMQELYSKYGYYLHKQLNMDFEGQAGMERIMAIMTGLRENKPAEIAGIEVVAHRDYAENIHGLPLANVIEFLCKDGSILTARPSGTEPKIKFYLTAAGQTLQLSQQRIAEIAEYTHNYVRNYQ